ncbi:selenium metabolism-associated LysR family transcriptional regulator [uncultured Pseudodesulfovibrio sp.]|uniref:selenium metabolism-associated LysR family transcriptional regulator n=1 Tax=uncultured Pseudodesulfovibrio sp. TaxID=2035858 RepID=UPI0029C6C8CC|nr:selenium metabolism-associated LysR family transcriptional regulator [uncultured Pseudodesulfovibrio sp.]
MDIRKLEAFCKVYELKSFSKAGEDMFLSQPTVSSHIANLEAELGVRLFDRLGRKVIPTQAGDVLYRSSVRVFENLEQAKASIEMLRDKVVGELVVGCSTVPSHTIMPNLLGRFSRRYPDVEFSIHTGDSSEVINRVAAGDWPIGIVGREPVSDELTSEVLFEDENVVVAAGTASWLPEGHVSVEDLVKLPWIMREKGSGTRQILEDILAAEGRTLQDLNVRCRVDSTSEAMAHTIAGVGMSMTSLLAAKPHIESGAVKRIDVPELAGKRDFYLIYHSGRHVFPALQAFVDFALQTDKEF